MLSELVYAPEQRCRIGSYCGTCVRQREAREPIIGKNNQSVDVGVDALLSPYQSQRPCPFFINPRSRAIFANVNADARAVVS